MRVASTPCKSRVQAQDLDLGRVHESHGSRGSRGSHGFRLEVTANVLPPHKSRGGPHVAVPSV